MAILSNSQIEIMSFFFYRHAIVMLEACKFYFVKTTSIYVYGYRKELKLTIEHYNGSHWHAVPDTNLFWALPGIKNEKCRELLHLQSAWCKNY